MTWKRKECRFGGGKETRFDIVNLVMGQNSSEYTFKLVGSFGNVAKVDGHGFRVQRYTH
jgi:hypothetical protein